MMNMKCVKLWMRRDNGMTLVETAVGAALLGTLLTAIVIANSRLTTQTRFAQEKLEACRIAEEILESWQYGEEALFRDEAGEVAEHAGWRWHRRVSDNEAALEAGAHMVTLRLFAPGMDYESPAVEVEILVPKGYDESITSGPDFD